MTGKPISLAFSKAVSASGMMSEPGVMGTPLAIAVARAVALSPIIEMSLADGPMKVTPEDSQISAKRAFSDRKP